MNSSITHRETIAQIWSALGLALVYITINSIARAWWNIDSFVPPLSGLLNSFEPLAATVFGILIGAPLLACVLYLGFRYLTISDGGSWPERLPIALRYKIDVKTQEGKAYQLLFLCLFILFPFVAQLGLLFRFFVVDTPEIRNGPEVSHWVVDGPAFQYMWIGDSGYRFAGTEYYVLAEPLLFILLELALLVAIVVYLRRVFVRGGALKH